MAKVRDLPYRPCVGVMLVDLKGRILVGQRIDNPGAAWQMPQGGVDPGERPVDAALRELWEETGVGADLVRIEAETPDWVRYDLPEALIPTIWGGKFRGQEQKWFRLRFLGRDADIRIATRHPEFSAWKWTDPEALVAEIVPFKRDVYAQVLRDLGKGRAYF